MKNADNGYTVTFVKRIIWDNPVEHKHNTGKIEGDQETTTYHICNTVKLESDQEATRSDRHNAGKLEGDQEAT